MKTESLTTQSRKVVSNQAAEHDNLTEIVCKHLATDFQRPIAQHNIEAYQYAISQINKPHIIFDSGCGNGKSTLNLASRYPEAFIIGIDKSHHRLNKLANKSNVANNYCLVRADLIDFWRLAANDNIKLLHHFILYPNPWPKKHHLKRRWHGSPVFKQILALGGMIELRSNWQMYLEEFSIALSLVNCSATVQALTFDKKNYISDFEAKYHSSEQTLWQLNANLDIDTD
ncbi:MAG: tRNA (guanine(46)-N(7))-methyltransferase TrmB [Pseudomonadales bacterium]